MRTTATLLHDFSPELRAAQSVDDIARGADAFRQRLLSTGCFKDVRLSAELGGPAAYDVRVALDESSFTVNTGASTTASGVVTASTDFAILNPTGHGEAITLSVGGSSAGEVSLSDAQGLSGAPFSSALSASGDPTAGGPVDLAMRLPKALSPAVTATLRIPSLWGFLTPLSVRVRTELERHDAVSGFSNRLREAEATVTDSSGQHSLSYTCALRDVIPRARSSLGAHDFVTGASAEVCADAESSLKSSMTYAFVRNRFSRGGCLPASGSRTALTAEIAGLGGDVSFFKTTAQLGVAASAWRFAPDTGYVLPLTRRAFISRSPYDFSDAEATNAAAGAPLRPHPGPAAFGGWLGSEGPRPVVSAPTQLPVTAASARPLGGLVRGDVDETTLAPLGGPRRWTLAQQIAGWLAPGITLRVDASLGALVPLGADVSRRPTGSRIVDRFFLFGSQVEWSKTWAILRICKRTLSPVPYT